MVMICVVHSCRRLHNKESNISFHRFPFGKPRILNLWIEAVRRGNWRPSKYSKLCSLHFLPTDFKDETGPGGFRQLKEDAVPSIFDYSDNEKSVAVVPSRRVSKRCYQESSSPSSCSVFFSEKIDWQNNQSKSVRTFYTTSLRCDPNAYDPELLRKKIKLLQQNVRRRDRKLAHLTDALEDLKKGDADKPSSRELPKEGIHDISVQCAMGNELIPLFPSSTTAQPPAVEKETDVSVVDRGLQEAQEIQLDSTSNEPTPRPRAAVSNLKCNEFALFGQQVGVQLNKLSERKALEVQHAIQTILTRARLSELSDQPNPLISPASSNFQALELSPADKMLPCKIDIKNEDASQELGEEEEEEEEQEEEDEYVDVEGDGCNASNNVIYEVDD